MFRFDLTTKSKRDHFKELKEEWQRTVVVGTLEELGDYVWRQLRIASPRHQGFLTDSWTIELSQDVTNHRGTGEVFTVMEYAEVMDLGRRPGKRMPPEGPIMRWVELVIKPPAKELKNVTYLVRRKIAKDGIKAFNMTKKAADQGNKIGPRIASAQIDKFVNRTGTR